MKLVEPWYCIHCDNNLNTSSNVRFTTEGIKRWCSSCNTWRKGIRASQKNFSTLMPFSYDDMGCYLERE